MLHKLQLWSERYLSSLFSFKRLEGLCLTAFILLFFSICSLNGNAYSYEYGSPFNIPVFKPSDLSFDIDEQYRANDKGSKPEDVIIEKKPGRNQERKPASLSNDYKNKFKKKVIKPANNPIDRTNVVTKQEAEPQDTGSWIDLIGDEINKGYKAAKNTFRIPKKPWYQGSKRKAIIVIDPGHGGKDPGAIGKLGTREKDITLSYSKALRDALLKTGRYKVYMTRSNDKYVGLNARVNKARWAGGDVLISIHADSIRNPKTRGFSIYTISKNRAEREAKKLLRKANKEEVIKGVELKGESRDVQEAIIDFAQSETKDVSDNFSEILAKYLKKKTKPLRNTNREGSLAVLTGADIPSVLIELGYLSNRYEEKLLRTGSHRKKMVASISAAIDEYFNKYSFLLE
jgi:N-acetylmuramoyl-L-alanine amidase